MGQGDAHVQFGSVRVGNRSETGMHMNVAVLDRPRPFAVFCVAHVHSFHSKHFDTPEQRAQKQTATPAMLRAGFDLMVSDEYNHVIRVVAPGGMCV
jgi:hypothetical protein